jgi:septal ring factor EnvC (AmiA/AmiB activator)
LIRTAVLARIDERAAMAELLDILNALMRASNGDLDELESKLTDGYAQALSLEAERRRLERRISELALELGTLAKRLDGNAADLGQLRAVLADLRAHADGVRTAQKLAVSV